MSPASRPGTYIPGRPVAVRTAALLQELRKREGEYRYVKGAAGKERPERAQREEVTGAGDVDVELSHGVKARERQLN